MTIQESLIKTQGKGAGFLNGPSAEFAQMILEDDESVEAAVTANIFTRKGHFPGVVALTDKRIFAVCGLPGIHRLQSLPLKDLIHCGKSESPLTSRFYFCTRTGEFNIAVSPAVGKTLTAQLKKIQTAERYKKAM